MIFESVEAWAQAAECKVLIAQNLLDGSEEKEDTLVQAASLFEKGNLILRSIECYEQAELWKQLLQCLHRNSSFFKELDRQALVNKYVPIALNSIYREAYQVNKASGQDMNLADKAMEKTKKKYQADEIKEEDEYGNEISSEEQEDGELTVDDAAIETIGKYFKAINEHKVEKIVSFLADDVTVTFA